jgi:hypothetical protein
MLTAQDLQIARNQVIREIDAMFLELLERLETNSAELVVEEGENYDSVYPLSFNAAEFKGKKPTSLIFGKESVPVLTWRMVFEKVMERCNADVEKHNALMSLRSKVSGRARIILSDRPDGMRTPTKIAHKLYAETHYDTPTLLHVLLHRILDPVKYDYSNIYVTVRM